MTELPDFERPPVVEVIAAVQFVPLPQFGMREAVAVSRAFEGWDVVEMDAAFDPIVEAPSSQLVQPALRFVLGSPPRRLILASEDQRWIAQIQQDRIAAHERKVDERPSFAHVAPRFHEVAAQAGQALGRPLLAEPHNAEIVEVIYENRLEEGNGWSDFSEVDQVLRVFGGAPGTPPFDQFEQAQVAFAYELTEGGQFVGRLRVIAEPQVALQGTRYIHLRLISHRMVHNRDVEVVLDECHTDIVRGFAAVTTEQMHEIWGRIK